MRWTIGLVVFLLESMGFTNIRKERVAVDGKNKLWLLRGKKNGVEYEGVGVTARLAFEDLVRNWFEDAAGRKQR